MAPMVQTNILTIFHYHQRASENANLPLASRSRQQSNICLDSELLNSGLPSRLGTYPELRQEIRVVCFLGEDQMEAFG